jgi:thioredoxin-like negative regulator of GroEL
MGKKKRSQPNRMPTPSAAPATSAPAEPVSPAPVEPVAPVSHAFFETADWIAAAATFLVSGAVFLYFMSPSVTLQDSGELVTGSYNFGVPHPPGYPLWAFLGWVWRHLVPLGNPAWRTCLMSVVTGATLVGVMTLLMTRSILSLLRASPWNDKLDEPLKHWIGLTVGSFAALMFGFNRGVWLWASVPEMRVLNVFMFVITACFFFAWMMRPERHGFLYATILTYALGMNVHQTIFVMALPLLIGTLVATWWLPNPAGTTQRNLSGFYEFTVALLIGWLCAVSVYAWLQAPTFSALFEQKVKAMILFGPLVTALPVMLMAGIGAVLLLVAGSAQKWLNGRRAAMCTAMLLLGCAFYLYMPVAASTNPPMNWGFTATRQGFLHHITRGQYERLNIASPFSSDFFIQIKLFTTALMGQYTTPLILFAVVTLVALIWGWKRMQPRGRSWLIFVWSSYLVTSFGLLTIINPGLEKQQQEINIKFFAPAHGFFAMLIGYGIALALAWALSRWPQLPRLAVRVATAALLVLPVIPFKRNYAICEQRGHDFGYQFGYRMFNPGGGYPEMDRDAVLYGGTDPGRFVPTYMIFCESFAAPDQRFRDPNFDRRDVYIITQNALADNTYMSYIRDHYDVTRPNPTNLATLAKFEPWQRALFHFSWRHMDRSFKYPKDPIYIPSETDLQRAFQEYVEDVQRRKQAGQPMNPDENVEIVGGSVQVRGVGGVMAINGILTKWIFDRNKEKHSFYVEESYPIPWMFPYLEPFGIIMKINKEPLPSPEQAPAQWGQIVERDRAYWDKLCADFTVRPEFKRDGDAQKTFSKLRAAIGGVYAFRKMYSEAVYAYQQALRLCPDSPEANFRLAQIHIELGQVDEAIKLLSDWQQLDPLNRKITDALRQIEGLKQTNSQIAQLEVAQRNAPRDVMLLLQLAQAYARINQMPRLQALVDNFVAQPGVPAGDLMQAAQVYLSVNQVGRAIAVLETAIGRFPQDAGLYYALALLRGATGGETEALAALERAIALEPSLRDRARNDMQFGPLRGNARFQQLVSSPPPP